MQDLSNLDCGMGRDKDKGNRLFVIGYSLMAEDRDAGGTEFVEFIG